MTNGTRFTTMVNYGTDGIIDMGARPGKVTIYGKFNARSEKYIPLLEYKLLDRNKPKYVYVTNN